MIPRTAFHAALILAILALAAGVGRGLSANDLRQAIFVMRHDGTGLRKVVQIDGYQEHGMPVWSHDGKRLAFDAIQVGGGAKKIFVVNIDGSGLKEIGETETPDWSPDDKQVACRYDGGPNMQSGIYVQNIDGQGRVRIADGHAPRWSPDGSQLAYTDGQSLRLIDLVAGSERGVIEEPVQQVMPGCDWSPDGKQLAVVVLRDRKKELWIVEAEGAKPQWKSRLKLNLDPRVAWSPDGKRLAISVGRRLVTLEPDGKGTHRIPGQLGDSVEPAWSPDGQWLAFSGNHPPQPGDAAPTAAN